MTNIELLHEISATFINICINLMRIYQKHAQTLCKRRLFDRIGFGAVRTSDDEIFKSLVVMRLYRPGSKLRTLRYMAYFMNMYYGEDRIYRYLDELCHRPGAGRKAGV